MPGLSSFSRSPVTVMTLVLLLPLPWSSFLLVNGLVVPRSTTTTPDSTSMVRPAAAAAFRSWKKTHHNKGAMTHLWATTITPPPPPPSSKERQQQQQQEDSVVSSPTAWECDDELTECVQVPACDDTSCRTSLDVRIHGTWYDVSGWRKGHPAGSHWIDWYDGRDATEVMDAFHSVKGRDMYRRLPVSAAETAVALEQTAAADTATQLAFRNLRSSLEEDGWWERDYVHEATQLFLWGFCVVGAALTAHTVPFVSTCLLSVSFTAAGWLGHDYVHGVDDFCNGMRNFAAVAAGLSPTFWSDKHNKHHALTNEQGVDEDIATDPFLYTWAPDPAQDSPIRKIQHFVFWVPFSALFALWRYDSVTAVVSAIETKRPAAKDELYGLLLHYAVLLTVFPWQVWLPSIFVSGLISALIVTPTHQSEKMFDQYQADWVSAQFESTRNAVTTNPFSEWIWGGMQYQLEHHLFPSMPRNKYPALKGILQQFATENNIPGGYRESNEWDILKMNWQLYKDVAEADAVPGAPMTRGRPGQIGAIDAAA